MSLPALLYRGAHCAPAQFTNMNAYYLIGEHLTHSFSAEIHRQFGRYEYELQELAPGELEDFLHRRAFLGLNVTIPYKEAVIPYIDHLDPQAAAIGAVNTVVNRNGVLCGYNTDFGGMQASLLRLSGGAWSDQAALPVMQGKTVLILGSGGTSKTALALCGVLGVGKILRLSRTGKEGALSYADGPKLGRDAAWIINCTPAGMFPDLDGQALSLGEFPARHSARSEEFTPFPHLQAVFDCVYNPIRTRLVLEAKERGIPSAGGLYMLVKQAALSCQHFTGIPVEETEVETIYRKLHRAQENLVLIGMPGSGKTTVGRLLAQRTGRAFVDVDEEIVRRTGKTIPAIFASKGEEGFRNLESAVILDLAATGGRVIATGGGSVLRWENVRRLRQNGRLLFLDRPLEALTPTPDRPLGDSMDKLWTLYDQRRPHYLAATDQVIANAGNLDHVVENILKLEESL